MFLMANVLMYSSPLNFLYSFFYEGYHNAIGTPVQTYLVGDFDSSQWFVYPVNLAASDTAVFSHEIAEWMNDPLVNNTTPAWGNVEYFEGCFNYLEVADPLGGIAYPAVTMSNGFTYHLQELAFFSWYFGGDPLGVNGWYSDNGTFLTDAGPLCQ
jgi:hypothetical protein